MERTRWLPGAAVAFLAIGLHLRTLGFEFVFDDLPLIVHNAFLREPWSPLTCFAHDFWHGTPFGEAYETGLKRAVRFAPCGRRGLAFFFFLPSWRRNRRSRS